jgi:lysine-N-methylase
MKLTVITPEIRGQLFDCQGCTNCCRELVVYLTAADRRRIDEQKWGDRLGAPPYVRLGRGYVLNHSADGGCVFLQGDGLCRIHAEHGLQAKPLACQLYPFTVEREGESVRSGIRFDCPTVQKSEGRAVAGHRAEISRLTKLIETELPSELRESPAEIEFAEDCTISRATLDKLLAVLDRWASQTRHPLQMRLVGLHSIVNTLNTAKLHRFDDERLLELVTMLADDLPTALEEVTHDDGALSSRQLKLFRQSVFAHGEYLGFDEMKKGLIESFRFRRSQLKRASAMGRGAGVVPPMGCGATTATFEQIESVGPAGESDRDEVDLVVTRYLQSRIINRGGFGRPYYGWSVLAGLNATLLAMSVIGWFARWNAATDGRSALMVEDVRRAVGIVDRTSGRAPELGAKSARLRLQYLVENQGLLRLLERYRLIA